MSDFSNRTIKGYELRERVGAGGFGEVYRAYQPSIGREVAIKVILPERASNIDFIRRFEVEAQTIARLEHPHIVPLYDYWRDPEGAFLVMRWLQGSLRASLRRGPWSPEASARLLEQIAGALMVAHREDVIHRDIKPDNILLDEDENAYLADFGIAKDLSNRNASQTEEGTIVGSPAYITPEQIKGELVTGRSDIYSLGLVIYEMLIADKPYPDATTPYELISKHLNTPLPPLQTRRANLPAALNEVLQTATAKNPAQRYATVGRFATAFRAALPNVQRAPAQPLPEPLTGRELDILRLILEGRSNKEIAAQLHLSNGTVRWYVQQIYTKLDVHSRNQAIDRARQLNILNLSGITTDSGVSSILIGVTGVVNGVNLESDTYLASLSTSQQGNPYKGLRAFQEADTADFFGRAAFTEQLLARMVDDKSGHFLAVVGPSGSGKSSVVRAGLIPALRRGGLPNSSRWLITEMMPGTHPFEELEAALLRIATTPLPGLIDQLSEDRRGLVRAAKRVLPADQDVELVLLIDQFEEVFTLLEDETTRSNFIDSLLSAATDPRGRVWIVLTLRADFYDRPLNYPHLGELMRTQSEIILPLNDAELERAIAGPTERIGIGYEPGLITAITRDVSEQPGTLPLLQYALTELFERRKGNQLTLTAYQELGGIAGALARRADELYNECDDAGKEAVRQMFLRLITPGEGTEDTRRRVLRSELDSTVALDEVINAYTQYRLLTLDRDPLTRGPTIEVAHESLIRTWSRLREWLADSREALRIQRRLLAAVGEWNAAKQDRSFLASGARLTQFESLLSDSDLALNASEKAYLDTSIKERGQQIVEEQTRYMREKAIERRSRNFLRSLVVVLITATLGALALTGLAVNQSQIAHHNAELSQSLALASAAQGALTDGNIDQALALSVAGNQIDVPPAFSQRILYDAATAPATIRRFPCTSQWCWAFDVSPDERTMLTIDPKNEIVLSDIATNQRIQVFRGGHTDSINWVKFLADGKRFVSTSNDDQIILWDIPTGQILYKYMNPAGDTNGVDISPDGRLAAVATERGVPFIWNLESGQLVRQLTGHDPDKQVQSVAFSPDGRTLLTGSEDTTMILWDVQTGQALHRFQGHTNLIFKVGFSPDGKFALSTSFDNTMIMWNTVCVKGLETT